MQAQLAGRARAGHRGGKQHSPCPFCVTTVPISCDDHHANWQTAGTSDTRATPLLAPLAQSTAQWQQHSAARVAQQAPSMRCLLTSSSSRWPLYACTGCRRGGGRGKATRGNKPKAQPLRDIMSARATCAGAAWRLAAAHTAGCGPSCLGGCRGSAAWCSHPSAARCTSPAGHHRPPCLVVEGREAQVGLSEEAGAAGQGLGLPERIHRPHCAGLRHAWMTATCRVRFRQQIAEPE